MFRWFDSNHRLNDQGFIDLELPQIFYTSIFQHKSKPHISKRDFKLDAKQNSCFYRKYSSKKSFQEMGAQALALAGWKPATIYWKRFFGKVFFFLSKYKCCFEFALISCRKMCGFNLCWNILVWNICGSSKSLNPWSFNLWLKSNHLNIICKVSNYLYFAETLQIQRFVAHPTKSRKGK